MSVDFNQIKGKAADLAQTGAAKARQLADAGVNKAKQLAEIGKLKVQNRAEQDAIRKAYLELGKLYYAERGSAPEAPYAGQCQKITDSKAKIDYNLERIADIKAAGNITEAEVLEAEVEEEAEPQPEAECPCCCGEPEAPKAEDNCGCGCGCDAPTEDHHDEF